MLRVLWMRSRARLLLRRRRRGSRLLSLLRLTALLNWCLARRRRSFARRGRLARRWRLAGGWRRFARRGGLARRRRSFARSRRSLTNRLGFAGRRSLMNRLGFAHGCRRANWRLF